jgi:hypothetical protein
VDKPQPCVPLRLRLRYEHVKLGPERVKHLLTMYGQHSLAYTHLDKNYRHFEVGYSSLPLLWISRLGTVLFSLEAHGLSFRASASSRQSCRL